MCRIEWHPDQEVGGPRRKQEHVVQRPPALHHGAIEDLLPQDQHVADARRDPDTDECQGERWHPPASPRAKHKGEACRKVGATPTLTASARIDVSDAQGRDEETDSEIHVRRKKMRDPGEFLDKESPIQGPWCRFRREARARERHRHTTAADGLKALDPNGR